MNSSEFTELQSRYESVRKRVPESATLVAVSKTQPTESIAALHDFGQRDFGENYVQELVAKAEALQKEGYRDLRWHFIGHLQTNKVKQLIPWVHVVHSVDSEKLARELAKRWSSAGRQGRLPVFIEVNIDEEASKSGVAPSETPALAGVLASLPELELQGLMCIPTAGDTTPAFRKLRELESTCRPFTRGKLSMGMTHDFESALAEGATHVRVGTALFGPRKSQ
jgi:pyridoxal phosphate enzyme (YggS family)